MGLLVTTCGKCGHRKKKSVPTNDAMTALRKGAVDGWPLKCPSCKSSKGWGPARFIKGSG